MPQLLDANTVYPFLEDGLQFLRDKQVLSDRAYAKLSQQDKLSVFGSKTIASLATANELRRLVVESAKLGESESEFAKRIADKVDILRSDANRILRTNTKQHYVAGMTKSLEKPHIQSAFPYVLYVATHDGRTREEHRAMDGKIALVGSPEYAKFLEMQSDWNCRCSLIPLTAKQAKARGVAVPAGMLT